MLTQRYLATLCLIALLPISAPAAITVKRAPPDIQYKTFDPAKPPPEMPHLKGDEAAVTTSYFNFSAQGDPELVSRKRGDDGKWTAVVSVHRLILSIQLHVVVYVPQGATEKLKAHEDGHRKLVEQVYLQRASDAARAAAAVMDGHRLTGEGPDAKTAADVAVRTAVEQVGRDYMNRTADVSNEVNATYDELTNHGGNNVPEEQAMRQAWERYDQNHPATPPAATKPALKK